MQKFKEKPLLANSHLGLKARFTHVRLISTVSDNHFQTGFDFFLDFFKNQLYCGIVKPSAGIINK
jgi:hypothetical protein